MSFGFRANNSYGSALIRSDVVVPSLWKKFTLTCNFRSPDYFGNEWFFGRTLDSLPGLALPTDYALFFSSPEYVYVSTGRRDDGTSLVSAKCTVKNTVVTFYVFSATDRTIFPRDYGIEVYGGSGPTFSSSWKPLRLRSTHAMPSSWVTDNKTHTINVGSNVAIAQPPQRLIYVYDHGADTYSAEYFKIENGKVYAKMFFDGAWWIDEDQSVGSPHYVRPKCHLMCADVKGY